MATATIKWTDPVNRVDGTAIAPDTFVIKIFDSAQVGPLGTFIGSVNSGVQTFTTGSLSAGVHVFTLTAVDSEGDSSVETAGVTLTLALSVPLPPTDVTVALD